MPGKKRNLAYITNDSMRKAIFNKRKRGFLKKLYEISVLCGIDACTVINNPFNSNPEVWPSNLEAKNVIDKFQMMSQMEQEKKMLNHEGFLRQTISKMEEKNKKMMQENEENAMKEVMFLLLSGKEESIQLNDQNLEDLCKYIDQYLKELYHHKNKILHQSNLQYGESSLANNVVAPRSMIEMSSSSSFPNLDVFNSSQPNNGFWSSQTQDHANAFSSGFVHSFVPQHDCYPAGAYQQNPNLHQQQFEYPNVVQGGFNNQNQHQFEYPTMMNQHQFEYPTMIQGGFNNQNQIQNQQQEWLNLQEMSYPSMVNNNYPYHH